MELYVAGIKFNVEAYEYADALEKCEFVINLLPEIVNNAKRKMGNDVIVLIVLQEYAFTLISIPSHIKKLIVKKLETAIANFPNLILIPGSFAYHSLNDRSPVSMIKRTKIAENYALNNDLIQIDHHTADEKKHFETIAASNSPMYVAHNVAFLMSTETIKHHKSVPWNERDKLFLTEDEEKITSNIVYRIGADDPVKLVIVNENTILDLILLICREHGFYTNLTNKQLQQKQPTIQVVVSASIPPQYAHCYYSACSIFMDSETGLNVVINNQHAKFSNDLELYAEQYNIDYIGDKLQLQNTTNVVIKDLYALITTTLFLTSLATYYTSTLSPTLNNSHTNTSSNLFSNTILNGKRKNMNDSTQHMKAEKKDNTYKSAKK